MMIHPRDPSMTSGVPRSPAAAEAATIDGAYRLLVSRGLSAAEAGNVVAYTTGLRAAERGWTVGEIKHLMAIRSWVRRGILES